MAELRRKRRPPPPHPGEHLRAKVLPELNERGLADADVAARLGLTRDRFNRLVRGAIDVTPELALRLGKVLGPDAAFWLHMQADYSLWRCDQAIGASLDELKPFPKPRSRRPSARD